MFFDHTEISSSTRNCLYPTSNEVSERLMHDKVIIFARFTNTLFTFHLFVFIFMAHFYQVPEVHTSFVIFIIFVAFVQTDDDEKKKGTKKRGVQKSYARAHEREMCGLNNHLKKNHARKTTVLLSSTKAYCRVIFEPPASILVSIFETC